MDPDALAALAFWLGLAGHCLGSPVGVPVARAARAWAAIEPAERPQGLSPVMSATPLVVVDRQHPRGRTVCAVSLRVADARPGVKSLCGVDLRDSEGRVVVRGEVAVRVLTPGVAVVHVEGGCVDRLTVVRAGKLCGVRSPSKPWSGR